MARKVKGDLEVGRNLQLGQVSDAQKSNLDNSAGSLIYSTDNNRIEQYNGTGWVAFGGGLPANGVLGASGLVGQGIYTLDGTNTAFSLPASTGNQDRYIFLSDVGVTVSGVTMSLTNSGDTLSLVTDGTYTFSQEGEVVLVIDRSVGNWDVQVVGASSTSSLNYYSIRGCEIDRAFVSGINTVGLAVLTSGVVEGGSLGFDEVDTSVMRSGDVITIPATGLYSMAMVIDHTEGNIGGVNNQDTDSVNQGGIRINGANIEWLSKDDNVGLPDRFISPSTLRNFTAGDTIELVFDAAGAANEDLYIQFSLAQQPISEAVLAGMVPPNKLHRVYMTTGTNAINSTTSPLDLGDANFVTASQIDTNNIINTTTDALDIKKDGLYRITFTGAVDPDDTDDNDIRLRVNTVTVAQTTIDTEGSISRVPFSVTYVGQLSAGDEVDFDKSNASHQWENIQISLEELPTSTVVDPDALTPSDLARFSVSKTSSNQVTSSNIYPAQELVTFNSIDIDTDGGYASNQYVVPAGHDGLWKLNLAIETDQAGTLDGMSSLQILVNGSEIARSGFATSGDNVGGAGSNDINYGNVSKEVQLNVGDVVEAYVSMQTGINLTANATTTYFEGSQQANKDVVAYQPGQLEATALVNGFTELAANTNFTTAYSDVLTLTLPVAGRYRVHGKVASNFDLNADPNTARLTAGGVEIAGTEITLGATDAVTGNWRGTHSTERVITVTGPTTIALQCKGQIGGGANVIYSSTEGNTSLGYEQLPTTEVVTPGDVPVEDVRVLLGSGAGLVNNDTITISDTWGNLASTYEAVEFEFIGVAGTDPYRSTNRVSAAGWVDNTDLVINSDATVLWQLLDMDTAGSTSTVNLTGTAVTSVDVNVYGVKSQKTVINTTDTPVNDQAASGYIDIGNVRYQWGTVTYAASTPIVFPAAFADANYSITGNPSDTTSVSQARSINFGSRTTTQVSVGYTFQNSGSSTISEAVGSQFTWQAIGEKP